MIYSKEKKHNKSQKQKNAKKFILSILDTLIIIINKIRS